MKKTFMLFILVFGAILMGACGDDVPETLDTPTITDPETGDFLKNCLTFRFTPVSVATGYQTQVATDEAFTNIVQNEMVTSNASVTYTASEPDTLLYCRVKSLGANGAESDWSDVVSVNMSFDVLLDCSLPVPSTPNLFEPVDNWTVEGGTQMFEWEGVANAFQYQIQVAETPQFGDILHDNIVTETSSGLSGFQSLHTYYWRVRAFGNDCWSDWSVVWDFSIL